MSQSTSNSNSGANSGIAEQIQTPAQSCAQCVKSSAECQLRAGKSVACARCQSRKEKCEFAELRHARPLMPGSKFVFTPSGGLKKKDVHSSDVTVTCTKFVQFTTLHHPSPEHSVKMMLNPWYPVSLKQVYGQLQSHYCAVRWDQQQLSEMYTRMEHAVGALTDWAMTEDAHFTAGLTPRFCRLSPTPSPPMTDFTINDELREQSLNPTLDNIFFDFDVPEEKWEEYLGGMEVKQEDNLGVGTSGIRSDEVQEEMEVKDGLVTLADEDLEFDGEEWGGIPEEEP
ncbi:hypothetical protein B0H10DRAFT_1948641 [Mycena sp. CBHHK59/15]|nr:hypothetical protein B0H10DRAFT_1948641 [Mycena sp. CBHHK59/15]